MLTDDYTDMQLGFAYASAANNGTQVFISFDFNWYNTSQGSAFGAKIAQYAGLPTQLFANNNVFASSFAGDGVDGSAILAAAGSDIYWAPNFHPRQGDFSALDGALNWVGWESNRNNKAPNGGVTVTVSSGDQSLQSTLAGKGYIAPTSPWFSTHFGPEVSFSKNWVFPGDLLWYMRWVEILALQPTFVEIITWNDYGESHYIGPLPSQHTDDGSSKWTNDICVRFIFSDGWVDMAKLLISAYKIGATSVNSFIASDQLIYWYRVAPKGLNCDSTDTTMQAANNTSGNYFEGRPDGFDSMLDNIFVVTLLTAPSTVVVNSGGTAYTYSAPARASAFSVSFHLGTQSFSLTRNGAQVVAATSFKRIQNVCPCGLYNFNAYVGTVPASAPDSLQPDRLAASANGLKVACAATPSLPATPPDVTPATTTILSTNQDYCSTPLLETISVPDSKYNTDYIVDGPHLRVVLAAESSLSSFISFFLLSLTRNLGTLGTWALAKYMDE
ncbi:glycosyl hydrolase family 71-domain-containing protein [Mycena rosella]|uniref:Glycosyl hydrolase family 71-domain-containing protein n=1 Tax=Mycena rosella TaxID=1033263 RepID=A0AAD7G9G9_MYCRO|nr:glycosyl hydrolase family 71-domain-containing protein [Mycena rosella]